MRGKTFFSDKIKEKWDLSTARNGKQDFHWKKKRMKKSLQYNKGSQGDGRGHEITWPGLLREWLVNCEV